MRIGVSLTSDYSSYDGKVALAARHATERARAAYQAGLDSLFVGDHHAENRTYLQNVPMLARMLAEWGSDRTAGCLFLLPLWNPVLLAEQVGTLAALHDGPFVVQCGIGYGERQFAAMGTALRYRPSAFEESLDLCRRLWAGEEVSADGRFRFANARIDPRPPHGVEVWHACGIPGLDRAARLGDGWLGAPGAPLARAAEEVATYLERCAAHGRTPAAVALRRDVYVGASEAEAAAVKEAAVARGYRGFPPEALVAGTVESVAEHLASFAATGVTEILCRHLTNDQDAVLASMARLGEVRQRLASL